MEVNYTDNAGDDSNSHQSGEIDATPDSSMPADESAIVKRSRGRPPGRRQKTLEKPVERKLLRRKVKDADATDQVPDAKPVQQYQANLTYPAFSKQDKKTLLKALNTHGYNDLKLIHRMLPHKSLGALEMYLRHLKVRGMALPYTKIYFRRIKKISNIDKWIEVSSKGRSTMGKDELVVALELIADYEEHPPPELCGGVDFKKLYKYLSQITRGDPPTEMPLENYALLKASMDMLQSYKLQLPMASALSQFISKMSALHIQGIVPKTYAKKSAAQDEGEDFDIKINPFKINNDLLIMDPSKIENHILKTEFADRIPSKRQEKILFHVNGYPLEKDLILTALRAAERPVMTVYKCYGEDIYINMPYASTEDLKNVYFTADDSNKAAVSTIKINIAKETPSLMTTLMPESLVKKKNRQTADSHILKMGECRVIKQKPAFVHTLPTRANVTDVQYLPKYFNDMIDSGSSGDEDTDYDHLSEHGNEEFNS